VLSVTIRRSLTPPIGLSTDAIRAMRRAEPRDETSARVVFRAARGTFDGWALNMSRGGLRAILEVQVELGECFDIQVHDDDFRPGRVVWLQEEPDGMIVGVEYLDIRGTVPPAPDGSIQSP
jgi:hypothetical protein